MARKKSEKSATGKFAKSNGTQATAAPDSTAKNARGSSQTADRTNLKISGNSVAIRHSSYSLTDSGTLTGKNTAVYSAADKVVHVGKSQLSRSKESRAFKTFAGQMGTIVTNGKESKSLHEGAFQTDARPEKAFRKGIERSLEVRATGVFRASLQRMTPEQLGRAIAASTAAGTVVEVLNASPEVGLQQETVMTRSLARGAVAKQEMIVDAGGCLSSSEVAQMLGITPAAVNIRRTRRTILTVPLSGGEWGFPARQFTDGEVRTGVSEIVRAAGEMNQWVLLSVLLDHVPGEPEVFLLDRLDDPEVRRDVLTRISSYGEHAGS